MEQILTDIATTISDFKKNPNQQVKLAGDKPFAVLTNNKASFYVLSPKAYDDLLEALWEAEMTPVLLERAKADPSKRVRVNVKDL